MNTLNFISITVIICTLFCVLTHKAVKKIKLHKTIINEITVEIDNIVTLDDCEKIKNKIQTHYNSIELLHSDIKTEYIKLYYITIGIEKTLNRLTLIK